MLNTRVNKVLNLFFIFFFNYHPHGICSPSHSTSRKEIGKLRIAAILPLSGSQAKFGQDSLMGIELALEFLKKYDRQFSTHIEVLTYDDRSTPNGTKEAFRKALKENSSVIVGTFAPMNNEVLAQQAHVNKIPLIIPADGSLRVGIGSPYIFRSCYLDQYQGNLLARFAKEKLQFSKAGVLLDPKVPYSHDIVENFKKTWQQIGGEITKTALYHSGDNALNLKQQLQSIASSNAEFIVFPSAEIKEASIAMKTLTRLKIRLPLFGSDRWHNQKLANLAKKSFSGHFYSLPFNIQNLGQNNLEFVDKFKNKAHRFPSQHAALSYDALLLAANAYKRARTSSKVEIIRSLSKTKNLPVLTGNLSINSEGTAEKSALIMETTLTGVTINYRIDNLKEQLQAQTPVTIDPSAGS